MKAHLINCTYCIYRQVTEDPKNKKKTEELCTLTYRPPVAPNPPVRFCENFHQQDHDCEDCIAQADLRTK